MEKIPFELLRPLPSPYPRSRESNLISNDATRITLSIQPLQQSGWCITPLLTQPLSKHSWIGDFPGLTRRFRSFFLSPLPPSISWRSQEFHCIGPHCYVFRRSGRAVLHKSEMNYLASIESRACEFSMDGVSGNRMIYLQKFPRTTNLGGGENYACAYVLCQFRFFRITIRIGEVMRG